MITPVKPTGIAKSLNIGDPAAGLYALEAVRRTGGWMEYVDDDEIRDGIRLLARTTGVFAETAGGVTIGGAAQAGASPAGWTRTRRRSSSTPARGSRPSTRWPTWSARRTGSSRRCGRPATPVCWADAFERRFFPHDPLPNVVIELTHESCSLSSYVAGGTVRIAGRNWPISWTVSAAFRTRPSSPASIKPRRGLDGRHRAAQDAPCGRTYRRSAPTRAWQQSRPGSRDAVPEALCGVLPTNVFGEPSGAAAMAREFGRAPATRRGQPCRPWASTSSHASTRPTTPADRRRT